MIIDFSTHVLPSRMFAKIDALPRRFGTMTEEVTSTRALTDMDERFRTMDLTPDVKQVISLCSPALEEVASPEQVRDTVELANDEMAELVRRYPDRFHGFLASLSLDDVDWSLREMDRAFDHLGAVGLQFSTEIRGAPVDDARFDPIFAALEKRGKPALVHPARSSAVPDFPSEDRSLFNVWHSLGWPFMTSVMMWRLICKGIFDRYPEVKLVTHHMGGNIPFHSVKLERSLQRTLNALNIERERNGIAPFKHAAPEYWRMFYADTAMHGAVAPLKCGISFFGTERLLFGTDAPFGTAVMGLDGIDKLSLDEKAKSQILSGNALRLIG